MKAYIYPITARLKTGLHNPYLDNFVASSSSTIDFLNYDAPSNMGILDLWKYLLKVDILFLNWIENLPDKKLGKIQWKLFRYVILPFLKFRGVKVCWTLHNKLSHDKKNTTFKKKIFDELFSISDYIITHAGDGKQLIQRRGFSNKLIFFHHPVNERNRVTNNNKEIDIFIWGSIAPYKAIDVFLDQVLINPLLRKFNILIAGKIIDEKYKTLIETKLSSNVKLINRFLSNKELEENLSKSKITLFTYNKASILSSGALSDSIGYGNVVVGPDSGAFKDLKEEKLIYTFKKTDQIPKLCEQILSDFNQSVIDEILVSEYILKHSWSQFSKVVNEKILN